MLHKTKISKGFTIVELIIVIVVIGILAVITIVAYSGISGRATDTKRVADADTIVKALNLHRIKRGSFPSPTSVNGSWEMSAEDAPVDFLESLKDYGLISAVPVDPVNTSSAYSYYYYRYGAGSSGCDADKGAFFVFGIKDFRSSEGVSPDSPGWACPDRNWESEFEWVTGGFES